MDDLRQDLKEIKALLMDLIREDAKHNEILRTHEARSIALQQEVKLLEAQLNPIRDHVSFVEKLLKFLGAVAVIAAGQWLISTFF